MTPETAELVRYRLARASESLAEARLLLANDHVRTTRSRGKHAAGREGRGCFMGLLLRTL